MIVVLGIVSILASTALPGATGMLSRSKTIAAANRLVGTINLARQSAVAFNGMVTVCALKADDTCGGDWAERLTLYLDRDANARLDPGDEVINHVKADPSASVTWRSFGSRQYLQMTPFGYTNYQNGNFVVCPESGDVRYARQLVVNVQGRIRQNHRRNDAGLPVDRKGKPLRC